jgi:D-alanine-D-alanine ligase
VYDVDSNWTPQHATDCMNEVEWMAESLRREGHPVELAEVRRDIAGPLRGYDPREVVLFNWCEGIEGAPDAYDLVADRLDALGFAYTGSDAWTLAHTQNKADFKRMLDDRGIPTPRWRIFTDAAGANAWTLFPAIVKPVAEHCSSGMTPDSVVDDATGLRRQIECVLDTFGKGALVEEFIDGREIYASIWGDGKLDVLPLHEIEFVDIDDPRRRIVDYEAKWVPESLQYQRSPERCPSQLDEPAAGRVRAAALAAYRALRCRDYGRIDLRVRDGMPYVIDVNPNCDITLEAGFTMAAKVAGYDYGAMVSRIVALAERRRPV